MLAKGEKVWIPWRIVEDHEARAKRNHHQTLERLAERGGLSPCEIVALLEDRPWESMPWKEAWNRIWEAERAQRFV